jgi:hypothetical protein
VLQRDEGEEGGAAITEASEAQSQYSDTEPPSMHTLTDDTHVLGAWLPLHRCSRRPRQWSSTGAHRATSVHPAALSCAPCDTVHSQAPQAGSCVAPSQRVQVESSHPPPPSLACRPQHCNVNDATLYTRRCW